VLAVCFGGAGKVAVDVRRIGAVAEYRTRLAERAPQTFEPHCARAISVRTHQRDHVAEDPHLRESRRHAIDRSADRFGEANDVGRAVDRHMRQGFDRVEVHVLLFFPRAVQVGARAVEVSFEQAPVRIGCDAHHRVTAIERRRHRAADLGQQHGIRIGEPRKERATLAVTESVITHNDGYGASVVAGNAGSLAYCDFSANRKGVTSGTWARRSVNTKSPGYLSTAAGSTSFLKIPPTSYQFRAGPARTPIGARYGAR